jgi:nitrite reductase/ring-hydroxylating ferredoxin subunit
VKKVKIADWGNLKDCEPSYTLVVNVDLFIIRCDEEVSIFYGRCLHRGALLADGLIRRA